MSCILVLDQGLDASRAIVFDGAARIVAAATRPVAVRRPLAGRVEQDALDVAVALFDAALDALAASGAADDVAAIGLTTLRDSAVFWDRPTGVPVCPAIVERDMRAARDCAAMRGTVPEMSVNYRTGLPVDPRFTAARIAWVLDRDPVLRRRADEGKLAVGALDSWLLWNLTAGTRYVTDVSNASRTMLYNLQNHAWDLRTPDLFGFTRELLPTVVPSFSIELTVADRDASLAAVTPPVRERVAALLAMLRPNLPIAGIADERKAALYGRGCLAPGAAHATLLDDACELIVNTGSSMTESRSAAWTSLAWHAPPVIKPPYDPFGDEGGLLPEFQVESWDRTRGWVTTIETVVFGEPPSIAPDPHYAFTLEGDTARPQPGFPRSLVEQDDADALDEVACQVGDLVDLIHADTGLVPSALQVDGPAVANAALLQAHADLLGIPIVRSARVDATPAQLGVLALAGVAVGVWPDAETATASWAAPPACVPTIDATTRRRRRALARERTRATRPVTVPDATAHATTVADE